MPFNFPTVQNCVWIGHGAVATSQAVAHGIAGSCNLCGDLVRYNEPTIELVEAGHAMTTGCLGRVTVVEIAWISGEMVRV